MLTLDEFFKLLLGLPHDTYIVELHYKYNHEKEFIVSNEILEPYNDDYIWVNDWDEGQTTSGEVYVGGFISIYDLDIHGKGLEKGAMER